MPPKLVALENTLGWKINFHRRQRGMWEGELAEAVNDHVKSQGEPITYLDVVAWQQNEKIPTEGEFKALLHILIENNKNIPEDDKASVMQAFKEAYSAAQTNGPQPGNTLGGLIMKYRARSADEDWLAAKINDMAHLKPTEGIIDDKLISEIEYGKQPSRGLLRSISIVLDAPELMQNTNVESPYAIQVRRILKDAGLGYTQNGRDKVGVGGFGGCADLAYELKLTYTHPEEPEKIRHQKFYSFLTNAINNFHPDLVDVSRNDKYKEIFTKILEHQKAPEDQIVQFGQAFDGLMSEIANAKDRKQAVYK